MKYIYYSLKENIKGEFYEIESGFGFFSVVGSGSKALQF